MTVNVSSDYFVNRNYLETNFLRPLVLLNGNFNIWQRYTTLTNVDIAAFGGYTADRWMLDLPAGQTCTVTKGNSFVTSNSLSNSSWALTLSNSTSSLPSSSQYLFKQRIEGTAARQLLYRPVVLSGKAETNKAGVYSAVMAWTDSVNSKTSYCVVPITLLGTGAEESFTAIFPPCPSNFTPVIDSNLSLTVGLVLAGNLSSVTNIYLNVTTGSESYCAAGQVNFFSTISNYISLSQVVLNAGVAPQPFIGSVEEVDRTLCTRYFERKALSGHLVNLFAGTSTHFGSIAYAYKRSTPTLSFTNTTVAKATITNSANVYYNGGSTAVTQVSFAAATRTTDTSSGFTFNTASNTPAGNDTGYLNQDVLINSEL